MVLTADSGIGAGFANLRSQRQPFTDANAAVSDSPNNGTDSQLGVRVHAFKGPNANTDVLARIAPLQPSRAAEVAGSGQTSAPERQTLTRAPGEPGDRLPRGSDRTENPDLAALALSYLRTVSPAQVTDRVSQPWYRAFYHPENISLKHTVSGQGTCVTHQILSGPFKDWTKMQIVSQDGMKGESVRDKYGKLHYERVADRDGWTITEPTYAVNPDTGREQFFRTSVRVVTSADGQDRVFTYDKGRLDSVDVRPLKLLT